MKLHLIITFCLLNVLAECKWRPDGEYDQDRPNQFDSENHIVRRYNHDKGHHHNHHEKGLRHEEFYHVKEYNDGKEFPYYKEDHHGKEFPHENGYRRQDNHQNKRHYTKSYRDAANEISTMNPDSNIPDPPDHTKLVQMARYVLHNSDWASVATISVLPSIEGFPFSNVKSLVDGSVANSTGVPYFYMSPLDFTAKDLARNSRSTILVSLEETKYCEKKKYDPEDPRCTRLMLSGKMKRVKEGTSEYKFAKDALFERHPAMADFPADHDWFVAKLKIAQVAMVDWFGGAKYVSVKDYLAYNYTGQEKLQNIDERKNLNKEETYAYLV